jgi:hypothetical protein
MKRGNGKRDAAFGTEFQLILKLQSKQLEIIKQFIERAAGRQQLVGSRRQ